MVTAHAPSRKSAGKGQHMLFNSYIFILFFLPVTLTGYFLLNRLGRNTWAKAYLLAASLWFYGFFNYSYLPVILSSILVNYAAVWLMQQRKRRGMGLAIALIFDLGMLFYFKYYDFFISNVNTVFRSSFNIRNIVLPLGISFFTFQQISYVVDAYHGEAGQDSLLDYAMFITFFPQLIAGPIVTHDELIPQIKDPDRQRPDYHNLSQGLITFALGLFKKVIIADTFGGIVDWGFGDIGELSSLDTIIVMLSYTMQIYFDFSAYSDMAIGIGRMFNFQLPVNFNSPYKAYSIVEFWQRWHMTLTRFLKKYVYIPLGGNRKGKCRTYLNIMAVYLVSGIWHGASWTYVAWGAMHGIANVLERMFRTRYERLHKAFQWLATFLFLNVTWLIFRAGSTPVAIAIVRRLLSGGLSMSTDINGLCRLTEFTLLKDATFLSRITDKITNFDLLAFLGVSMFIVLNCKNLHEGEHRLTWATALGTVILLVWCICSLSGVTEFLYFNF
jgi:D-alanyl-lipoteichoic acid acyltransferase DltB (MBOAT superfamily)